MFHLNNFKRGGNLEQDMRADELKIRIEDEENGTVYEEWIIG